jgi:hypothetical protein
MQGPFLRGPALVVRNDVVRGVFDRLGMVGAILLASAIIFAVIAGGVVAHRLEAAPAASSVHEQGNNSDEQGDGPSDTTPAKPVKPTKPTKPAKPAKPANPSPEPDDSQDKDA